MLFAIQDFPLYRFSSKIIGLDEIRKLGGKVFLAHLFTYPLRDYESI